jgi:hypothetical protein
MKFEELKNKVLGLINKNKKDIPVKEKVEVNIGVRTIQPIEITDFCAIDWVRKAKGLPAIERSAENAQKYGNLVRMSPLVRMRVFIKYVENTAVEGVLTRTLNEMILDFGSTEKPVRSIRDEARNYGILVNDGKSRYIVDYEKISEWRKENG